VVFLLFYHYILIS